MENLFATLEYEGKQYTIGMEWGRHPGDTDEEYRGHAYYMWTDGNYGCDCNRFAFISYDYDDYPGEEDEDGNFRCGETIKLVSLVLDGYDLLAPTLNERMAAIGLVPSFTLLGDLSPGTIEGD